MRVLRAALSGALALRRLGFLAFWFFVFSVRLASWLGGVLAFWLFGFSVLVASWSWGVLAFWLFGCSVPARVRVIIVLLVFGCF